MIYLLYLCDMHAWKMRQCSRQSFEFYLLLLVYEFHLHEKKNSYNIL